MERLARFLLEIHSRRAMVGPAGRSSFDLPFSQEVLGDAPGLSVPHLNRMLARLRADGFITLDSRHVQFTDLKGIQMLAHFQPLTPTRIPTIDRGAGSER